MRRLLPTRTPAILIPVALLLALTVAPAFAEEAQEFKAAGVNWTLPDGWSFSPVSSAEQGAGFFAKVECSSASVEIWAYAKATDGLSLDERVAELKQAGGEGMGTVAASKTADTTVSGVKGKVVVQRIKADGGATGHFRKYVIVANGKFYQLLMRCWHDAHKSVTDEINAVRAGFRLLKGAGGKDAAETMKEVDGAADSSGSDGSGSGGSGSNGGDDAVEWPANGPKREGSKVSIPNHNFAWELSKKSEFHWLGAIEDAKAEGGRFLWAAAKVERKKQEFEKNTPDHNVCFMDIIIQKATPGWKPVNWIKGGHAKKEVTERWGMLDDVQTGKTRTKDEVKFGNHKAAYVKFEGTKSGRRMVLMIFATVLREKLYLVRARVMGHTDAYKQMAPYVGRALAGIHFANTAEDVRGPLLGMIPDYAGQRGEKVDEEKVYAGPGYRFTKPVGISHIKAGDSMNRDLKFVGEGRTEDGKAYIYFEIRTFRLNVSNQANPDPEKFIEKRAQDWEAGAGEKADLGAGVGKKLKYKKGKFGKAKGFSYEFGGELAGEPVIEHGWVVKHKQTMLWFKMQYIGADAETKLKKVAKAIKKGVKYNK